MKKTFTCEACKGTFQLIDDGSWTEEDAREESRQLFGEIAPEDAAVICDDCFKRGPNHVTMTLT